MPGGERVEEHTGSVSTITTCDNRYKDIQGSMS